MNVFRTGLTFPAAIAALAFPIAGWTATIDPAISIVGSVVGDTDGGPPESTYTETLYSVVDGVTNGAPVTNVGITDTGDGYGHDASLTGNSSSNDVRGGVYSITATNNHATDTFGLTFGISYSILADSDAGNLDARSTARLEVGEPDGPSGILNDVLNTEMESESGKDYHDAGNPTWQDRRDYVYQGTWGEELSDSSVTYFTIELLAGQSFDIRGEFYLRGRIYDGGATYKAESDMFIFLDGFENKTCPDCNQPPPPNPNPETIPVPAALPLLAGGMGLMGLLGWRRRRD